MYKVAGDRCGKCSAVVGTRQSQRSCLVVTRDRELVSAASAHVSNAKRGAPAELRFHLWIGHTFQEVRPDEARRNDLLPDQSRVRCPQRLKPRLIRSLTARLKSCPPDRALPMVPSRSPGDARQKCYRYRPQRRLKSLRERVGCRPSGPKAQDLREGSYRSGEPLRHPEADYSANKKAGPSLRSG
jgi:hypothetical protein